MAAAASVLLGDVSRRAAVWQVANVNEANAKMFRIVACPTAGSCGIVPAVILAVAEKKYERQSCIQAFFTAAGIGAVIARNACVAGAVGGCQAECGTAAAMAAAAVVGVCGGTPVPSSSSSNIMFEKMCWG